MPTQTPSQPDPFAERHMLLRPIRVMRRVKRRHRWTARILLATPLLLIFAGVVLTRSAVTRWIVVPRLERALNMQVSAAAVYIALDGTLVVESAKFRLPGVDGPAGDFLKVAKIEAGVDWMTSAGGRLNVRGIRMIEPVVVISQDLDDLSLNIGKLSLPASSGDTALPAITAVNAEIELAEHSPGRYAVLKRVQMDGRLSPAQNDPTGYSFQLTEKTARRRKPGEQSDPGFKLRGTLGSGRLAVIIEQFSLDDWPDSSIPTPVRSVFNQMHLAGEVPRAYLTYTELAGIAAKLELRGVGMDLPIQPTEITTIPDGDEPVIVLEGPPPPQMRLHGVNGSITFASDRVYADVQGMVENLPYQVKFQYDGITDDAPFTCELVSNDFRVDRNPRLLPYAPPVVKERLQTFSSPTAIVNTRVLIRRGEPIGGEPGEITLTGEMEMREGVAAFDGFPYEFRDLSGLFRFEADSIDIVRITGRSASGAELAASGRIAPLSDDAQVDVVVEVRNAPIDDAMQSAFGVGRGSIIPALFSTDRYDEMLAAGLIQTPAQSQAVNDELAALEARAAAGDADGELAARIGELRRRASIPAFAFRGSADISVNVHRPQGPGVDWQTTVDIRIPKVGLLPERFPLPIEATNVVARIDNREGRLISGEFRGITGGSAEVEADFRVPFAADVDQEVRPDISILASEIPLDELVIHAVPGRGEASIALKRILRDLKISGMGDGRIRIAQNVGEHLGFDADLSIRNATASPDGAAGVGGIAGRLKATEHKVELDLTGHARTRDAAGAWRAASGPLTARITADIPAEDSGLAGGYHAHLEAGSVSADAVLEPLIRVFSPAAADQVAGLRSGHNPSGELALAIDVVSADGGSEVTVDAEPRGPFRFDLLGGRFEYNRAGGRIRITSSPGAPGARVAFESLSGALNFNQRPLGEMQLLGVMPGAAASAGTANLIVQSARLESPLIASIVKDRIGPEADALWQSLAPRGLIDADLSIGRGSAGELTVGGTLTPRAATIRAGEADLTFDALRGSISFGPGMGAARQLALITPLWTATTSASWTAPAPGELRAQAELNVHGRQLAPDLRSLLPAEVAAILQEINFRSDGPFQLKGGSLAIERGASPLTRFSGTLEMEDASLDVGATISKLAGVARIQFERADGGPPAFRIEADADRLESAGIAMTAGRAIVTNGARAGEVLIPEASAYTHNGRVVASATILPGAAPVNSAQPPSKVFAASISVSGLRFASLIKDIAATLALPPGEDIADDRSRGVLEANLTLQGTLGKPESRRGRGSFQIAGGRILNVPFMMRLVELSNLQLPTNARLGYARGQFYLDGGTIGFEDIGIYSSAIQILGSGTMSWPGKALDLRFNTRPARGIPIISGLLRGIRDELVTTSVQGTLGEPEVKLRQFPGPRRMLGGSVGTGSDEPSVDAQRWEEQETPRPAQEGIRPSRSQKLGSRPALD